MVRACAYSINSSDRKLATKIDRSLLNVWECKSSVVVIFQMLLGARSEWVNLPRHWWSSAPQSNSKWRSNHESPRGTRPTTFWWWRRLSINGQASECKRTDQVANDPNAGQHFGRKEKSLKQNRKDNMLFTQSVSINSTQWRKKGTCNNCRWVKTRTARINRRKAKTDKNYNEQQTKSIRFFRF